MMSLTSAFVPCLGLVSLILAACGAAGPPVTAPSRVERQALRSRAKTAYRAKAWPACAALYEEAHDAYGAACCHALAGAADPAFAQLTRAIDDGRGADLASDTDLASLHADPRWPGVVARLAAHQAERRARLHPELLRLYDEDQADRARPFDQIDWTKVGPRDQARRARVDAIIAGGEAQLADDYFHAAMVYQHGDLPAEIQRAHDLALKAVELDPGHDSARWLAAAAEDRKLMYEHKPQKWGTQFKLVDGRWVVWQVDPAITDAQRAEWNVPALADAEAQAAELNGRSR